MGEKAWHWPCLSLWPHRLRELVAPEDVEELLLRHTGACSPVLQRRCRSRLLLLGGVRELILRANPVLGPRWRRPKEETCVAPLGLLGCSPPWVLLLPWVWRYLLLVAEGGEDVARGVEDEVFTGPRSSTHSSAFSVTTSGTGLVLWAKGNA